MPPVGVVTGANRGLGLEFCRQLRELGYTVFAACRRSSPELDALGVTVVPGVEVGVDGGCDPLAKAVGTQKARARAAAARR